MKKIFAILLAVVISIPISAYAGDNRYPIMTTTNRVYEFISYSMYEEGDELLLLTNYKNNMTEDDVREQLRKNVVPNQVKNIKTISAIGIEKLLVNAESCGIVVETIEGSDYTVDYIGVQNKASIAVSISTENGILSVLAQGRDENRIVSTVRGSRINVVRIGVPKNSVKEIDVQNDTHGCIMIDGIDVPVSGNAGKGSVRVQNERFNTDINLEAGSGDIIVKGNAISSNIAITVANGSAYVEGKKVDGNLRLSASNGEVNVTAGSLKNGEFTAANGEVNLTIGTIIQKVSAKVSNGDMAIQLLEKPINLRYVQTNKSNADISLPYGWKDGYQVGNGSALLEVSVGNGDYSLTIKKNMESIVNTYYSAQNSPAFEMFNKKIFANLADDWTAEIDGIKNPVWNYDSFASYQILDYNVVSVTRHKELYYCTFSADNDKYGYVVMSYDGSSLQKVSVAETPYLYDLRANIKEIEDGLSETDLDLSSAVASRVKWVDTNKNRSDEVILYTDKNGYVYTIFFFED